MDSEMHEQDVQNGSGRDGGDEDSRKLFIGGLPPSATKEDVESYFSKFGPVEMCTIKTDVYTGRSRGFGFLIFSSVDSVDQVLNDPEGHEIAGKKVDPKLATPQSSKNDMNEEKSSKVFVGGIEKGTTKEDITAAFAGRGNVVDVYLPIDKMTGAQKGFAFVNFDDSKTAEALCSDGKITINGKECDVKKATNKNESRGGGRGGFRGGRGGRGGWGGRGNYGGDYGSGYDQYGGSSGYGGGMSGGYGGGYAGYDQYSGGAGYQGGYTGGSNYYDQYSGGNSGFDQNYGYNAGGYNGGYGHGQGNKLKGGANKGGSNYQPY